MPPAMVMVADSKFLKPNMGRVLNLIPADGPCLFDTRLFRYLEDRSFVRVWGNGPPPRISRTARCGCCIAIQGDGVRWPTFLLDCLVEEGGLRCSYVSCPAEPEVDSVPRLVDCPIEIWGPFSTHLDIGLIDTPRAAGRPAETVPALDELWRISLYSAQDGRMGKIEFPARPSSLTQISEAQLVAQVPTHAQDNSPRDQNADLQTTLRRFLRLPIVSPRSLKTTLSDGISRFAPEPLVTGCGN